MALLEADGHKCPSLRRRFDITEVGGFCPPTSLINFSEFVHQLYAFSVICQGRFMAMRLPRFARSDREMDILRQAQDERTKVKS